VKADIPIYGIVPNTNLLVRSLDFQLRLEDIKDKTSPAEKRGRKATGPRFLLDL